MNDALWPRTGDRNLLQLNTTKSTMIANHLPTPEQQASKSRQLCIVDKALAQSTPANSGQTIVGLDPSVYCWPDPS